MTPSGETLDYERLYYQRRHEQITVTEHIHTPFTTQAGKRVIAYYREIDDPEIGYHTAHHIGACYGCDWHTDWVDRASAVALARKHAENCRES